MDKHGLPLPTLSAVAKKIKQLEEAKNFALNDDDIEKVWYPVHKFTAHNNVIIIHNFSLFR